MKEKLKQLHQKARLARDPIASEAYGAALAAIQEGEVRENAEFAKPKVLTVIEKEAGKFQESADSFAKAGRSEKEADLRQCAELLTALLPPKLKPAEYPAAVRAAIDSTGATSMKDMGQVMAALKKEHGAALDSKRASDQVKEALL